MDCLLTIDINTSTVKIHAFDMNGRVICCKKGSYPTFHPQPDYSEQDPEQIFITTLYILKNMLNEYIHPKKYKVKTKANKVRKRSAFHNKALDYRT